MNDELIKVLSHLNSSVNALKQSVEGLKEWKAEQHSQGLDASLRAAQELESISAGKSHPDIQGDGSISLSNTALSKLYRASSSQITGAVKRGPITDQEAQDMIANSSQVGVAMALSLFARSRGIL